MLHRVGHTQKTQNENHPHLLKVDVSNDGQTLAFTTTNTTHRLTLETKKSQEFPKKKEGNMGRSRYMSRIYRGIHRDEAHLNKRKYFSSCRCLSFEDIRAS